MKILYICPYLPLLNVNAGRTRMFELIKRLSFKNEVSIVSFISSGEERFLEGLKKICREIDVIRKDYPWRPDWLSTLPGMIGEYYYQPMKSLVREKLEKARFDIVHCEYLIMAQYAPEGRDVIKFLTEHEVHFLVQLRDLKVQKGLWDRIKILSSVAKKMLYEINACGKFDKVITMTDKEASILGSWLPGGKAISLPMGVDHRAFIPQNFEVEEDIDIIFTGFFGHYPNVDAVMYFYSHIFPLVREKMSGVKFTIVGSEPPDSILSLRRDKNIIVTGYVDDVRPYLSRSKVFIMPLRLGRGMRGKLFEAWGMGKPVVSTSVGCEGVDVSNGRNILIADEPEVFAEKLVSLIRDEQKRRDIGMNGRKAVEEQYNWDKIVESLEKTYAESMKEQLQ